MLNLSILKEINNNLPPLMTDTCKIEILRRISESKEECCFYEYGSGGSTLFFHKYCKIYNSVEHDAEWFKIVSSYIKKMNAQLNYNLIEVNQDVDPVKQGSNPPGKLQKYSDYIDYCSSINKTDKEYDIILIDGVARQYCIYNSLLNIHEHSYVMIHDYCLGEKDTDSIFRPDIFLKYYDLISVINSVGEGRGCKLTVLKPNKFFKKKEVNSFIKKLLKIDRPL